MTEILRFFRKPALSDSAVRQVQLNTQQNLGIEVGEIGTEWCFYVQVANPLDNRELDVLQWLLSETFEPSNFGKESFLGQHPTNLEIGPRLNFETAWSSTAVSIFHACGLSKVVRIERSVRFGLSNTLSQKQASAFLTPLHARMTQMRYCEPLKSFDSGLKPEPVRVIPVIEQGMDALRAINKEFGLSMDERDLQVSYDLFSKELQRNPTDVEIFQIGACNSDHCRHWFFDGQLVIDGTPAKETLMRIVKTPWQIRPGNSIIAFCDDSSAIQGKEITTLVPIQPGECSAFSLDRRLYHPTLTAETHNHPSAIEPYGGGATGGGGRIRDNQAVGRGGLVIAAGAGYCDDNLHIPGYPFPWEDNWLHPPNLTSPLEILIRASDGPSDYGNCFGEPIIYGFLRTFGMELPDGRRGWFKPVMYTVGAGQIDDHHTKKGIPEEGMLVVQIGGPAYRIGLGGGPASSMISGENIAELDFKSAQRGAPQMEQRVNRLIRACVELGEDNPIISIHDLGAVGDCNAITELINPAGAKINLRAIPLGDQSLSVLEYWGNESQERHAFLIRPDRFDEIQIICEREGIPCAVVGQITGDGWLILHDESDGTTPVRLPLKDILGELPQKTLELERILPKREPLQLPENLTVADALERVLRLPSVGSKRFLTTKVDRSVTGLIAQQQCVGPNQITLCDYAVIAQSHFGLTGVALSLGEQPIKGLISPKAMARMAVAEALLNMVGARITDIQDIKCSANWMVAAKLPGEGAWLYDAACALRDICVETGIDPDGGKDSLSMAAKTQAPDGSEQIVKAPGQLVIAPYAPMPDITCKVTPDIKKEGSILLFIDLAKGKNRLGGSALAQVYGQVGDDCPDVEDVDSLVRTFKTVQELIGKGLILSVHDRSDGGLITCLLEMAFAGNVGFDIRLWGAGTIIEALFSEELGLVIECEKQKSAGIIEAFAKDDVTARAIGMVGPAGGSITIKYNNEEVLNEKMVVLRQTWEETSSRIDALQANPECVREETEVNAHLVTPPPYELSFEPHPTPEDVLSASCKPKVAILRTRGSNGDREMASAFYLAGFETWDVTISDLLVGKVSLDEFRGIAFVGGFADADVLDAAKAWAGVIRFNKQLADQFKRFYERSDTFSFGPCNGCQLMALLGRVPWPDLPDEKQPRFIRNASERFECQFVTVKILPSPAIMLKDMEGSTLGVWVAHGEGRCFFPGDSRDLLSQVEKENLAPLRFVDNTGCCTLKYPFNPNGSIAGITALCSPDGRHLAIMPHPERGFLLWQWPWLPESFKELKASPWLQLFQNAYEWC